MALNDNWLQIIAAAACLCVHLFNFYMPGVATAAVENGIVLSASDRYELFKGDLDVSFHIPVEANLTGLGGGFIQLVTGSGQRVASLGVPLVGIVDGTLSIRCGTIDSTGTFMARLLDRERGEQIIAESGPIEAVWPTDPPAVELTLPERLEALTGDLQLQLTVNDDELQCESTKSDTFYSLELIYLGPKDPHGLGPDGVAGGGYDDSQVIAKQKLPSLSMIRQQKSQIVYPCQQIDQAGLYQAVLRSNRDTEHPVAVSNVVDVVWSDAYSLSPVISSTKPTAGNENTTSSAVAILPCVDRFEIRHWRPSCSGDSDKIKLYWVKTRRIVDVQPADLVYLTERRVSGRSPSSVSFECRLFRSNVTAYCFKYVSTAGNGAVQDQRLLCLPTSRYTEPGWTSWSEWNSCILTTSDCLGQGRRSRHRTCDNPPPDSPYSPDCVGQSIEWQDCTVAICPTDTNALMTPLATYTPRPGCQCGCIMNDASGHVVAVSRDIEKLCPVQPVVWQIVAPDGYVILIQILDGASGRVSTNLPSNVPPPFTVKVIDGDTEMSNLLYATPGNDVNRTVRSLGSRVRIELRQTAIAESSDRTGDDFVATYKIISADDGSEFAGGQQQQQRPFRESSSFYAVVIVCSLVIILLGAGALLHLLLLRNRRLLRDKLDQSTPAHQALLPSSGTSGQQCGGSGHDAAGPSGSTSASGRRSGQRKSHHHKDSKIDGAIDTDRGSCASESSNGPSPVETRRGANQGSGNVKAPLATGDVDEFDSDEQQRKTGSSGRRHGNRRNKHRESANAEYRTSTTSCGSSGVGAGSGSEQIHMEVYSSGRRRPGRKDISREDGDEEELTCMLEQRPPVEGASMTRDKADLEHEDGDRKRQSGRVTGADAGGLMHTARYVPPTRSTIAAVKDLRRPDLDVGTARMTQLPLLQDGVRLDQADELSPLTSSKPLFPEEEDDEGRPGSPGALSDTGLNAADDDIELEYDDYIPELPGSYFSMDPHAYTLTWSKQAAGLGVAGSTVLDVDDSQFNPSTGGRDAGKQYY